MRRLKEFFEMFLLNLLVKKRNFVEFLKVIFLYYRKISFAKVDLSLLSYSLFKSPFKISKEFLLKMGEKEIYAYGETPLTTMDKIAAFCKIEKTDTVFELGCGRGRSCFWLQAFIGCETIGIEYIPDFIEHANAVKDKYDLQLIDFKNEDFLTSDFSKGNVFYLYGTCYETAFIEKLIKKFKKLKKGTKIITVSYSLQDFTDENLFEVTKKFPANFTWGIADVYLQTLK